MLKLDDIRYFIANYHSNYFSRDYFFIEEKIKETKELFKKLGNEEILKEIWCLQIIILIQKEYIEAFNLIKTKEYYKSWCLLEKIEININNLNLHYKKKLLNTCISFIEDKINKLQRLFPYRIFASPEILVTKGTCSICGKEFSLHNGCNHLKGEIYNGEMCFRNIENSELLAVAFVENPSQKYSVIFDDIENPEKYLLLNSFNTFVQEPFEEWKFEIRKVRKPHSIYPSTGRNKSCPCQSGKKYKKCCLNENGILSDHYIFSK